MTSMMWFRNDLRVDDNEALCRAAHAGAVLPVHIIDPRQFATTRLGGFPKTGPHRARFLLECLVDLRGRLRQLGSTLIVRQGLPEEVLPSLAREVGARTLFLHKEATDEEVRVERAVRAAVEPLGVTVAMPWGSTLHHPDDLPFNSLRDLPEVFTRFRHRVEKAGRVRPPVPAPEALALPDSVPEEGEIPSLRDLGLHPVEPDPRSAFPFRGGEAAARARLDHYFWQTDALARYKETRNGLVGTDYSSKFSPWLAHGCLSPRRIHTEVREYEARRTANESTYWMIFELLWRDYFRFVALRHGNALFQSGGIRRAAATGRDGGPAFRRWCEGRTGEAFVDANMRELLATGFMSNRGRQNVASHLVHDLGVHWRWGAEWFESLLLDYDPCSNWGNWNYVAGVGNDPREGRRFHIARQQSLYDPQGEHVALWGGGG